MTDVAQDTLDTKIAWLASLYNMAISLSLLRRTFPTICHSETVKSLKSATDLMFTVDMELEELVLRLMDTWGISRKEVLTWMDLGPDDYAKRMNSNGFIASHSSNSQPGQTRRSRKR